MITIVSESQLQNVFILGKSLLFWGIPVQGIPKNYSIKIQVIINYRIKSNLREAVLNFPLYKAEGGDN